MTSLNMSNENSIGDVEWNATMLKEFKDEYKKAVKEKESIIMYKEHQYVVPFAKYLIEYLEPKFK